mgnify:CR=1 FL=1
MLLDHEQFNANLDTITWPEKEFVAYQRSGIELNFAGIVKFLPDEGIFWKKN